MKKTYLKLAALSFTFLFSCTNSENNTVRSNESSKITADSTNGKSTSDSLNQIDISFLNNAEISKLTVIEISDKLIQSGTNAEFIKFAKKLVEERKVNNKMLENLAVKKKVSLPQTLPQPQILTIKQLENIKNDAKNEYYVRAIMEDYQKTIDLFSQATKSKDPDVAAFAEITKPTLENHYTEIKKLEKKIIESKAGQGNEPA